MSNKAKNSSINIKRLLGLVGLFVFCFVIMSIGILLSSMGISYAEEKSGIEVILPNMTEFIPMLIAFIVIAIIMAKFGWPMFDKMLETRKQTIADALKESEDKRLESERLLEEYKAKLEEAKIQADEIIKDAKLSSTDVGKKIEEDAQASAEASRERAKLAISQFKKSAEYDIKNQAVEIAFSAIEKLVVNDFNDEDHRQLIKKYINEAGDLRG